MLMIITSLEISVLTSVMYRWIIIEILKTLWKYEELLYVRCRFDILHIREYQDMDFFPDQLQTFIERCIGHQRFQM